MHPVLAHISKILPSQPTAAAAVLMAIKARIEFKSGMPNRIGKMFKDGNRGVLMIGKAGTAKTRTLRRIYEGLGLEVVNKDGRQIAKWFSSAGASTAVGVWETLETYNDSIIFLDEFSLDSPAHTHIIKQVCNGEIVRPRHDQIEPVKFSGMLVCATNAIKVPALNALEHLLATLDRFLIVKVDPPALQPEDYLSKILSGETEDNINWEIIKKSLKNGNSEDLSESEKKELARAWGEKSRQILDPTRAQWRNAHTAHDIFLFVKRITNSPDITKDPEILEFARKMIDDCIIFNPINILWLSPIEEIIYQVVAAKPEVQLQEILFKVDTAGMGISVRHVHNVLKKMVNNRIICHLRHGTYSIGRPEIKVETKESVNIGDSL